jgi:LPXTG-motif cell wall-anchored protein
MLSLYLNYFLSAQTGDERNIKPLIIAVVIACVFVGISVLLGILSKKKK